MFSDIVNLLKFLFDLLKGRKVFSDVLPGKKGRGVLHLYLLLDEIIESSKEHLYLTEHGEKPNVKKAIEHRDTYSSKEILRLLERIAKNTERFLEQLDLLANRLGIYLPELPRVLRLRMFRKKALVQWWIEVLDEKTPHINTLPISKRGDDFGVLIYAGSTDTEYLATQTEAIQLGKQNVTKLESLRDELRDLISSNYDINEVLGL
jgi:hypothetical protein